MNPQITQKKAEIFDVLAQQDNLKVQFNNLEQQKTKLLQELTDLLKANKSESVGVGTK